MTAAPTLVLADAEPVAAPAAPPTAPAVATPPAAPSAPEPRRSRWLLVAGVLVSVVAVGGFVGARKADDAPAAPRPPTPSPAAAVVPTPLAPSPPAPPATLELRLSSKPDAAQVEVDGLLVGHTPLVVTGREGAMVALSLTAPGFSKLERRVLLSRQLRELTLELEKPRGAPRSAGKPTEKQKPGLYDNPWE